MFRHRGCALNLDHLGLAQRSRIGSRITPLRQERWAEVEPAIAVACGFAEGLDPAGK